MSKDEQPTEGPTSEGISEVDAAPAPDVPGPDGAVEDKATQEAEVYALAVTVVLPHAPHKIQLTLSPHEQVHEVRQSINELPSALQYSCFHLEHNGERMNDYVAVSEIPNLKTGSEIRLVEDPYTEKEARLHVLRVRDLIGAAGNRLDSVHGILAGASIFDSVRDVSETAVAPPVAVSGTFDFNGPVEPTLTLPRPEPEPAPKTVKSLTLSPWNPPPPSLRQRGHLLYLQLTTNEGEQFQITAHVTGFYVNRSSNTKFDPSPKAAPRAHSAHSLLTLVEELSPAFTSSFTKLQEYAGRRDALSTLQITNALPINPWLVPSPDSPACAHTADATRSQETYLIGGADNTDTLRDWNEEFQSARELPRESLPDRVFRERLTSKLFADYTEAAVKGSLMVARGELASLNPTEAHDAQIYVHNNVFFSFSADGMGTFTSEGGDEAARVASGKDVMGVKLVNLLDIDGLYTAGTVVVDYMGRRMVAQSIVPGIFKQRDPGENQIDYGAVDGKEIVANDERFVPVFEKLARALKTKKHPVWNKEGKRFDLETSVETKGLMGTDARRYVLDLYRITPLDAEWADEVKDAAAEDAYPHRMAVLRLELVEAFARQQTREWVNEEVNRLKDAEKPELEKSIEGKDEEVPEKATESEKPSKENGAEAAEEIVDLDEALKPTDPDTETLVDDDVKEKTIDISKFKFGLNPDAFSGQVPNTQEEKDELEADEKEVRKACKFLRDTVIPDVLRDFEDAEISFPMDGQSLTQLLHKRGINVRYLGRIARLSDKPRLLCLRDLCLQEMISRAFKHIANSYLRYLPLIIAPSCASHLLNCLLGKGFNPKPQPHVDESWSELYPDVNLSYEKVSPQSLKARIEVEVFRRYQFRLAEDWDSGIKPLQLLREVSMKLGLQVQARKFQYDIEATPSPVEGAEGANGVHPATNGEGKKRKKKNRDASPASVQSAPSVVPTTFSPDDIVNFVPLVKDSAPKSSLAEDALESGRLSIMQGRKKLGQDLLLESLSLHEQIYGILHPEVARVYHSLSLLYFQLDDKEAALELARKAIIVCERTIGIDSAETLLDYLNLSLFLYQVGNTPAALEYCKHALNLWKVIYGPGHPDSITTINNAAVMLQHLKAYHESRLWFEEALAISEKVFGRQSTNSATVLFQLAQALALDQDPKAAVARMRESYSIFHALLGPTDKNTKEAESWLEQLTQNAVSIARHAKQIETRRMMAEVRFPGLASRMASIAASANGANGNGAAAGTVVKSGVLENKRPEVNARNIDELIKYIEGGDKETKRGGKKRPGRGNPKRRGGAGASEGVAKVSGTTSA